MAVTTETVVITTLERTWRIEIEMAADPVIFGHREVVKMAGDTVIAKAVTDLTLRPLSKVRDQKVSNLTVAQIVEMLLEAIEGWREKDIEHEAEVAPLRTVTVYPRAEVK